MSTAGSRSGATAAAIERGSIVGKSPCTLTTASWRPSGSRRSTASKIRSEPEGWSERVITASPPAARTASAIRPESVATATGPIPASTARRQVCTTIGAPPISARGLFGSRVAARRAGMRTMGLAMAGF
jgi:hypothetical protein